MHFAINHADHPKGALELRGEVSDRMMSIRFRANFESQQYPGDSEPVLPSSFGCERRQVCQSQQSRSANDLPSCQRGRSNGKSYQTPRYSGSILSCSITLEGWASSS